MEARDGLETLVSEIDWWVYVVIVCIVFSVALAVNYIIKKMKGAKSEPRASKVIRHHNQASQVQFQIAEESEPNTTSNTITPNNQVPGEDVTHKRISLVFDKKENIQDGKNRKEGEITEDPKNTTKKILEDVTRKVGGVSENANNTITASERSRNSLNEFLHTVPVSDRSSPHSTNATEENPVFLGKIYKDLYNRSDTCTKQMLTSKEISNSKETIPITTVNQVNIERSRENNKVEHNEINIDKMEQHKIENDKVEQNIDINCEEDHANVKSSKNSDFDSILNEIVEKTVGKSNTKI